MERKVIWLLFFLSIFLISNVNAQEEQSTLMRAQSVDLFKSVRFDGGIIPNATCNITVFYNETVIVPFRMMTYDSNAQTFNFTIAQSLTQREGTYPYDIMCCANNICNTEQDDFKITKTGKASTIQGAFFQFSMLIIAICLFVFCMFVFFKIDGADTYNDYDGLIAVNWKKYPKYLMGFVGYYVFIWIMYSAWNISYFYLDIDSMSKVFFMMYNIPMSLTGIFFIIFILFSIYGAFSDLMKMKEIRRFGEA